MTLPQGARLGARRAACAALLLAALGACARDSAGVGESGSAAGGLVKGGVSALMPGRKAKAAPAPDPGALAQAALASVKGPVMLASFQAAPQAQFVLGMVGENGAMRSYQTPDQRGVVLRGGILAATRGFGRDLMSSDTEEVGRLIRAAQAGEAPRVQRYLDGAGTERPLPMRCTVTPGATIDQGGIQATQVAEHCEGSGAKVDNLYLVAEGGRILASQQWAGPGIGTLILQVLRD